MVWLTDLRNNLGKSIESSTVKISTSSTTLENVGPTLFLRIVFKIKPYLSAHTETFIGFYPAIFSWIFQAVCLVFTVYTTNCTWVTF
jgi:hypothetical protein